MRNSPKKVLLLSLSGIGNYIMQSPAIAALKAAHPDWYITVWVAPRGTRPLAEADPNVDEVIEMPIQTSVTQHARQLFRLRQEKFDIAITLSPGQLLKSAAYMFLADIPKRIGNAYPFGGKDESTFLLTDAIVENPKLHDIEQNLRLLQPLGLPGLPVTGYGLQVPDSHQREATEIINQLHISDDKPLIGIHAGSSPELVFKRWPIERFAEVATALIQHHNAHILLFGGPDEEDQKKLLQASIRSQHSSRISASLMTTAAIMQHCKLVLSNDSGLMHIAAASGVLTVGLFGPTSEKQTGPRGANSHVIRAPHTEPVYNTEKNIRLGDTSHQTILDITPELVLNRLSQYL